MPFAAYASLTAYRETSRNSGYDPFPQGIRSVVGLGPDHVKQDLLSYDSQMKAIAPLGSEAATSLNSVLGENYTNDEAAYKVINESALPKQRDFVNKLQAIEPKTPEVKQLHELVLAAANKQMNGTVQILAAMEKQDTNLIAEANAKIAESGSELRNYRSKFDELAGQHGLVKGDS